ncbi:conserved hypothetical protein [Talaromyces stipitatus ATCC 10500]|uniref:RTA1 domain protein n=1 Tax=Talaromyces stipitatus (strain ATCC 10500 / CBS 375.48 / QM 6759 / NRRL 1006) TaxID=441959 RepID=B8MSI6_TALSN|nr:uncharacterized protein TSTA_001370 [Talaromyces stipitatus ATCC 10500]EED12066.1 conserved hypothetical protein [Talaromyces stipitatus ATCC 10500]
MRTQVELQAIQQNCHALIPGLTTAYGYTPSQAAGIAFVTLFGLSMCLHTTQMAWKRNWWCLVFVLGCLNLYSDHWYVDPGSSAVRSLPLMLGTTHLAPTFFTAGIYIILGRFINLLGRQSSVMRPSLYLWIFCTCDVLSLVVQAIGGGMASAEADKVDGNTANGTHIMVAGIIFQLVSITVFLLCAADFFCRVFRHKDLRVALASLAPLFSAMVFSVFCIYIRSIYRTIELLQGWSGYLITTERFFIALDGAMMVPAVVIFNIIHPGWFLPRPSMSRDSGDVEPYTTVDIAKAHEAHNLTQPNPQMGWALGPVLEPMNPRWAPNGPQTVQTE